MKSVGKTSQCAMHSGLGNIGDGDVHFVACAKP